jgi:predicted dinucleotide-binding enzyme
MTTSATRRRIVALALAALALPRAAAAAAGPAAIPHPIPRTARPIRIGVIGSGRVGGTLGEIWLKAGHQVMFSDRDPRTVKGLTDRLPAARGGTAAQAAAFGEVVLLSVPYGAMPDIARDLGPALRGKVVFDTGNPSLARDGEMARAALAKGSGRASQDFLPGTRLVRGFNVIGYQSMGAEAHRPGDKVGVMLAADDAGALALGERLVRDAGFDPVVVGGLASAARFELGGPAAGVKTAAQLRALLGLRP